MSKSALPAVSSPPPTTAAAAPAAEPAKAAPPAGATNIPAGPVGPQPPHTVSGAGASVIDNGTLLRSQVPAASTATGRPLQLPGIPGGPDRDELIERARRTDAWAQLARCFPRYRRAGEWLTRAALASLADNQPVDPNDRYSWRSEETHARVVLRRHGYSKVEPDSLTDAAIEALLHGQAAADQQAGLDWSIVTTPAAALDDRLRAAHARLPISLDDPTVWRWSFNKRRALAGQQGLEEAQVDDISRWAVENPAQFDAGSLRCWRIASPTWLALARATLPAVGQVQRPVGVFVVPDTLGRGWRLSPVLSLDMIRLVDELGGEIDRNLAVATIPLAKVSVLLERVNQRTLHAGPKQLIDSANQLGQELSGVLGTPVHPGVPSDRAERWGRLDVSRLTTRLRIRVNTFRVNGFAAKRLGSIRPGAKERDGTSSAAMDLGEAIEVAADRQIPVLLSTEASGFLDGTVRVGRMKGRPGMLTITRSDGMSASTERVIAEQAVTMLRRLQQQDAKVVLDGGARQLVRMTVARPLGDDPILLPPQRLVAAQKVVGAGLDISQTATGKTITTGRALYHRAATTPGLRAMVIVESRKISQWFEELTLGALEPGKPTRRPPLTPNCEVRVLDDRKPIAGQIRRFHRELGQRPGIVLVAAGLMERFARELAVVNWHFAAVDEIHKYRNTATDGHRALVQLRFDAIADFWGLTATPKGKDAANIDVLVGICVGDRTLIDERLNSREAGDLLDELNAARFRMNYGPHCVQITKREMRPYFPDVLPAKPEPIEADPALQALLDAIREGGRDAFRRLLELLHALKTLEKRSELYHKALVEFNSVQGMVLGNVMRFVDASVDPETLTHSNALLAKALVRDGLVADAMKGGGDGLPLLRGIVAQSLAEQADSEQILLFADGVWCLRQLAGAIQERYGVDARVATGATSDTEFAELRRAFNAGEFPLLCLSSIGEEGHNLQTASGLVHLDIPPVPDAIEQRVGRLERYGSPHEAVWTSIPYVIGGGVEHMVKLAAARGAESHLILEAPAGIRAEESTIAKQLGAITSQVADQKEHDGYAGTATTMRIAARIFGAG
jgi:Helicase conserved C-terminal domain